MLCKVVLGGNENNNWLYCKNYCILLHCWICQFNSGYKYLKSYKSLTILLIHRSWLNPISRVKLLPIYMSALNRTNFSTLVTFSLPLAYREFFSEGVVVFKRGIARKLEREPKKMEDQERVWIGGGGGGLGAYKCQLSVKILAICQYSVKC